MRKEIINTVDKGWHIDMQESNQPDGTYRDSRNGDILSFSNGLFTWENAGGNRYCFRLLKSWMYPIGFAEGIDKVYVFSVNYAGSYGEIGYFLKTNLEGVPATYTTLMYRHDDLNFSREHPITKAKVEIEGENIEKVYFTDDYNPPRVFNFYDLYEVDEDELVEGEWYHVVEGAVTHPPGGLTYVSGSIFEATSPNYTPIPPGPNIVRHYIHPPIMEFNPTVEIANFSKAVTLTGGSLYYGKYFLFVRLRLLSGYATPWSVIPTSAIITGIDSALSAFDQDVYMATGTKSEIEVSDKFIRLYLENIDLLFDEIEICAFWSYSSAPLTTGKVVHRQSIRELTSTSLTIDIFSYYGSDVTMEDILIPNTPIERVRTFEIIKSRLAVLNIRERSELPIGQRIENVTITESLYEIPFDCMQDANLMSEGFRAIHNTFSLIQDGEHSYAVNGEICYGVHYKAIGGSITYHGVTYAEDEVFVGDGTVSYTGTGKPQPVLHIMKYQKADTTQLYTDIPLHRYYSYKDEIMAANAVGYWGLETYRFGILFFDKRLYPYYVRWIGDKEIYDRSVSEIVLTESPQNTQTTVSRSHDIYNIWNARIVSLIISNIDLTDIIDDIGAFAIVRAPRDKQILSEGVMEAVAGPDPDTGDGRRTQLGVPVESLTYIDEYPRIKNFYTYYTPEALFDWANYNPFIQGDVIRFREILTFLYDESNPLSDIDGSGDECYSIVCKAYDQHDTEAYSEAPFDVNLNIENIIDQWHNIEITTSAINYNIEDPSRTFYNSLEHSVQNGAVGQVCSLLRLESAEDDTTFDDIEGFGRFRKRYPGDPGHADDEYIPVHIVRHRRPNTTPYNGTSDSALENTFYISTGHFQLVDDNFKADIENGGNYIVNNVQIFGGDCFLQPFALQRMMKNQYEFENGQDMNNIAMTLIVPIQSNINIESRYGRSVGKHRGYHRTLAGAEYNNASEMGITYNLHDDVDEFSYHEEFNYNWGNSTEYLSTGIPGLPSSYSFTSEFTTKVRYSLTKYPGATIDNYRLFPSESFMYVNAKYGQITASDYDDARIYYMQEHGMGAIPVEERALDVTAIGYPIQLGIGGLFERYDMISSVYGCQHPQTFVRYSDGLAWLDFSKKEYLTFDYRSAPIELGLQLGIKKFFTDEVPESYRDYKNTIIGDGIISGFDNRTKRLYLCFISDTENHYETICFNPLARKFTGHFDFYPRFLMTLFNFNSLVAGIGNHKLYVNEENKSAVALWFDTAYDSYIDVVIKSEGIDPVKYDLLTVVGNQYFFDEMEYRLDYDIYTDTYTISIDETNLTDTRYYNYVQRQWICKTPLVETYPGQWERLMGNYMKVRFIVNKIDSSTPADKKVKLTAIKTLIRKIY
jgi:hypothetical protein